MDPNATLTLLLEALANRDSSAAQQAASDLAEWLNKGGFLPIVREVETWGSNSVSSWAVQRRN